MIRTGRAHDVERGRRRRPHNGNRSCICCKEQILPSSRRRGKPLIIGSHIISLRKGKGAEGARAEREGTCHHGLCVGKGRSTIYSACVRRGDLFSVHANAEEEGRRLKSSNQSRHIWPGDVGE